MPKTVTKVKGLNYTSGSKPERSLTANPELVISGTFKHNSLPRLLLPQTDDTSVCMEAGRDGLRPRGKSTYHLLYVIHSVLGSWLCGAGTKKTLLDLGLCCQLRKMSQMWKGGRQAGWGLRRLL